MMPTERDENRIRQQLAMQERGEISAFDRCREVTEDSIRANPLLSTLAAFGIGLGFGAAVGSLLAEPVGASRRRTAETIGRRVLDSLAEALPDSVRQHLPS